MQNSTLTTQKYVLNLNALKTGDILLSRETATFEEKMNNLSRIKDVAQSKLISQFSNGFSHARLYVNKSIFEAVIPAVVAVNPQRLVIENKYDICVLRWPGLTASQECKIEEFVRIKIGSEYSVSEAVKVPYFRNKQNIGSSRQFCSRFVAQAYKEAGIELVHNTDFCAPGDFLNNPLLVRVEGAVRLATDEDMAIWQTPDRVAQNSKRLYEWLRTVQKFAHKDGVDVQTTDDALNYVMKYPYIDEKVAEALIRLGCFRFCPEDDVDSQYRYDADCRYRYILTNVLSLREMSAMEIDYLNLHSTNLIGIKTMNEKRKLQTLTLWANLEEKLIKDGLRAMQSLIALVCRHYPVIGISEFSIIVSLCNELLGSAVQKERRKVIVTELQRLGKVVLEKIEGMNYSSSNKVNGIM